MHMHGNFTGANFSHMSQQEEPSSKHEYLFTLTGAINQTFNLTTFEHANNPDANF